MADGSEIITHDATAQPKMGDSAISNPSKPRDSNKVSVAATGAAAGAAAAAAARSVIDAGALGLPRLISQIGNTTAMAIIAGVFLYILQGMVTDAREDRQAIRQELQTTRQDSQRMWEVLRAASDEQHRDSQRKWESMNQLQQTIAAQGRALEMILEEIRRKPNRPE